MKFFKIIILLAMQFSVVTCFSQTNSLRQNIENFLKSKKADVGVAIYGLESGDTLTFNNDKHFPMQSVYKFHLAFAVLDEVDKGRFKLNQKYMITKDDLKPNTWSPIREKYPEGNVELTLSEILTYTVSQSDNNGCDFLFKLIGGTKKVDDYIHGLGIKDVAIKATEEEMHSDWNVQFTNYSTPKAAVELLEKFFHGKILSKSSFDFLWEAMAGTVTGPDRIKGQLPEGTTVAHKTGSSGVYDQGIMVAFNDIGIVTLPNGKHFAIAVFVANSTEDEDTNAGIIAVITKLAWDYFTK